VGNATLTTATIHYNAITTHILSWWYETENKNNHYRNQYANYIPLSKNDGLFIALFSNSESYQTLHHKLSWNETFPRTLEGHVHHSKESGIIKL
jgi:hypothetical protein